MTRVAQMAKQLADDPEFRWGSDVPPAFIEEATTLSDQETLELATRLWELRRELRRYEFLVAASVIIKRHPTAFHKVRWRFLEPIGNMMDSWGAVDWFADLAGPAWRAGRLSDTMVLRWTRSQSRWWRRAALVCTVFLNRKARGGTGDTPRTLAVCEALAADRDDMVAKGLSWALRDLIPQDRPAVERFLRKHDEQLPALVKREVRNKLTTGRKNPPRKRR